MLGNILMIFSHKLDLSSTCTLIPLLGKVLFGSISIPFNLAFWFGLLIDLTHFITEKLPFKIGLFCLIKVDAQYDFNFNETIWFSSLDDVFPVGRYLKFETFGGQVPTQFPYSYWLSLVASPAGLAEKYGNTGCGVFNQGVQN